MGCLRLQKKKIFVYVDKATKDVVLVTNNDLLSPEELFRKLKCKRSFCAIPISRNNILLIDSIDGQLAVNDRNDASIINKCRYRDRIR